MFRFFFIFNILQSHVIDIKIKIFSNGKKKKKWNKKMKKIVVFH